MYWQFFNVHDYICCSSFCRIIEGSFKDRHFFVPLILFLIFWSFFCFPLRISSVRFALLAMPSNTVATTNTAAFKHSDHTCDEPGNRMVRNKQLCNAKLLSLKHYNMLLRYDSVYYKCIITCHQRSDVLSWIFCCCIINLNHCVIDFIHLLGKINVIQPRG